MICLGEQLGNLAHELRYEHASPQMDELVQRYIDSSENIPPADREWLRERQRKIELRILDMADGDKWPFHVRKRFLHNADELGPWDDPDRGRKEREAVTIFLEIVFLRQGEEFSPKGRRLIRCKHCHKFAIGGNAAAEYCVPHQKPQHRKAANGRV